MPQVFEIIISPKLKESALHNWRSQQGIAILWIIGILIAFAALGSAMVATYNVSLFGQVETGAALAAESMAESGYRFLFSEYQDKASDVDKNELLDEIRFDDAGTPDTNDDRKTFNISPGGGGQFQLEMTSYFYRVETDPSGGSSLALKFIGSEGFSVPDSGLLKIAKDETYYQYTIAPTTSTDTDGATIYTFTVTPSVPATPAIPVYTTVRPVVQTTIGSDVNDGETLTLNTDQGGLFPPENGMFFITKQKIKANLPVVAIVPYRYEYRNGDQLINVQKGPHHSGFTTIDSGSTKIEVAKFLKVESTGFAPDKASALASETNTFKLSLDISASSPGLKSYWSFDEAGTPGKDDYGTADGTLSGTGVTYTATGKVGGALVFDGGGQVSTTFKPGAQIGNNQSFTVVFWAKPANVVDQGMVLGSWNTDAVRYFFVGVNQSRWIWGFGNDWQLDDDEAPPSLPVATQSQWQHVAFVYDDSDPSDKQVILYVNGIEKYRKTYVGEGFFPDLLIDLGAVLDQTGNSLFPFEGTLDEIAIFNTALDICEIREIYNVPCNVGCGVFNTANDPYDPATDTGFFPVAYYPFNSNANDESGEDKDGPFNNDITVNTATLTTDRFTCEEKAYDFDGSNSKMEAPHSDSLELSDVNQVTVIAWVKHDDNQKGNIAIAQKSDKSYILRLDDDKPAFIIDPSDATKRWSWGDTPLTNGVWYHLAGVYDGTNVRIYVDGVVGSATNTANDMDSGSAYDLGIGMNLDTGGRHFDGQIDDISIWDQALTADQVWDSYYQTTHK